MINLAFELGSELTGINVSGIRDMYFYSPIACVDYEKKVLRVEYQVDEKEKQLSIIDTQVGNANMTCVLADGNFDRQSMIVDVDELLGKCSHFMNGKECYQRFRESGFYYGPTYQSMKQLYYGEEISIAEIKVSDENDKKGYGMLLNPSLMDAAFQAVLGFNQREETVYVLYYIEKFEIKKKLGINCFSIATRSKQHMGTDKKYNIQIVDSRGEVCVEITGFSLRAYQNNTKKEIRNDIVLCKQIWEEKEM